MRARIAFIYSRYFTDHMSPTAHSAIAISERRSCCSSPGIFHTRFIRSAQTDISRCTFDMDGRGEERRKRMRQGQRMLAIWDVFVLRAQVKPDLITSYPASVPSSDRRFAIVR